MNIPFPNPNEIDQSPLAFLAKAGSVVAVFEEKTQDSGNVSYGVEIRGQRFFVKTAGDPADTQHCFPSIKEFFMLPDVRQLFGSPA